jgi:hypothetical protein
LALQETPDPSGDTPDDGLDSLNGRRPDASPAHAAVGGLMEDPVRSEEVGVDEEL